MLVERSKLPPGTKLLKSMIILSEKLNIPTSDALHFKARFVVKGCGQVYGTHYEETWAPTMSQESINLLIFLAVQLEVKIYHFDVCTAFLNSDLKEKNIFVEAPAELVVPGYVLHLKKAIYGLRQAGREWFLEVSRVFVLAGCYQSKADPCIFRLPHGPSNKFGFIGIHVDDFLIVADDLTRKNLYLNLCKHWKMKDLGPVTNALGISFQEVSGGGYFVSQPHYIDTMLDRFGFSDCHPAVSPSVPGDIPESSKMKPSKLESFRPNELTGSLLWATKTRPEIMFAVNAVCQLAANPTPGFYRACGRVLKWLSGTKSHGLLFKKTRDPRLDLWADADHAGDKKERKSVTGTFLYFGLCPLVYGPKKQHSVAGSSTEAEMVAIHYGLLKLLYVLNLIGEMDIVKVLSIPNLLPVLVHEDNSAAIILSNTNVAGKRLKHMDIKYHIINEKVRDGVIKLVKVATEFQLADIFTKSLPVARFRFLCDKILSPPPPGEVVEGGGGL